MGAACLVGGGRIVGGCTDEVVGVREGSEEVGQLGSLLGVCPHLRQAGAQQLSVEVQERTTGRLPATERECASTP